MENNLSLIDVNSLFFIVLFIIPAAIRIVYSVRIAKYPRVDPDERLRWAEVILFAVASFMLNATLFNRLYLAFLGQPSVFEPMGRTFLIAALNAFASLAYCLIWNTGYSLVVRCKNKITGAMGKSTASAANSMWQHMFYENEPNKCGNVVCIERDGKTTVGMLLMVAGRNGNEHGLTLNYCDEIEQYFERDKECADDDKIFGKTDFVYTDLDNGYTITFYNMDEYNKHRASLS